MQVRRPQIQLLGDRPQALVASPKPGGGAQTNRSKQMGIDIAQSTTVQRVPVDEQQHFVVARRHGLGKAS